MTPALLEVRGLCTEFSTRHGPLRAVDDLTLSLQAGQVLGLVGESGSGKSVTGFSIMGLLDAPGRVSAGQVWFRGQDLLSLKAPALRAIRGRHLAMIFQDPMMTLNPVLSIEAQMVEAVQAHCRKSQRAAREQALQALTLTGIPSPEQRLRAYPHQLSGGMRQRVAIAIAMLHQPDLIIADEPTTALDVTIQAQILHEMRRLVQQQGTALIWISHDLSVVAGLADQIAVMYAGRVVEYGSTDQVLDHPQHPYTQGLIASLPVHNTPGQRLRQIPGLAPDLATLPAGCAFLPRCSRPSAQCRATPALQRAQPDLAAVSCFHPSSRN
jgi:peptide/nickel transport system ATP-binding protein